MLCMVGSMVVVPTILVFNVGLAFPEDLQLRSRARRAAKVVKQQLMEVNALTAELFEAGSLDEHASRMVNETLVEMEMQIRRLPDEVASERHELLFMVDVLRGTALQCSYALTGSNMRAHEGGSFSSAASWQEFYKTMPSGDSYDWYGTWETRISDVFVPSAVNSVYKSAATVGELLKAYLRDEFRVLVLGCGMSELSVKMYESGIKDIVNIDISAKVVEIMRLKYADSAPRMIWLPMDATSLAFTESSFDAVVDKGTLDALESNRSLYAAALREIRRTLRPGGVLLSITASLAVDQTLQSFQHLAAWGSCTRHKAQPVAAVELSTNLLACIRGNHRSRMSWLWPKSRDAEL